MWIHLIGVPVDEILMGVDVDIRHLALLDVHQHTQLFLAQCELFIVVGVIDGTQRQAWRVVALQDAVQHVPCFGALCQRLALPTSTPA